MAAIYLVRAGRTALSEDDRLQGREDPGLTGAGREDARRAARRLAAIDVALVYTSPLRRARQTADVIGREVGATRRSLHALIDVDVGRWARRTTQEIAASEPAAFDSYFRFPLAATFPSGERMVDAERRVLGALVSISDLERGRAVVAVTHELLIRRVLVRLRRLEGATAMWAPHVTPGSVTELRATPDGLELPTVLEELFRVADRRRTSSGRA